MIPDGCEVDVINASPNIGDSPKSVFRPDVFHLGKSIDAIKPDVILGCGRMAQEGLKTIGVSYIAAPHPSWRLLSNDMILRIKDEIALYI